MIPTRQTKLGEFGNCFAACLSSVLEVELGLLPDFDAHGDQWRRVLEDWLKERGYSMLYIKLFADRPWVAPVHECEAIFVGDDPNGKPHAVVGMCLAQGEEGAQFAITFNPGASEPNDPGITGVDVIVFLVPRAPATMSYLSPAQIIIPNFRKPPGRN